MNDEIQKTVTEQVIGSPDVTIGSWTPGEAEQLFTALEEPNWAPWLAAGVPSIAGRATVFPEGQLVMKEGSLYVASLSLNRIQWDGNSKTLPSWDDVAGNPTDYSMTYSPKGNTLVLLSMNVAGAWKGKHIPGKMITEAMVVAKTLGIEHLVGSFRPSGYGAAKKALGYGLSFEQYCTLTREGSDKPVDPWLGSLWHMGMQMIAVDHKAMTVAVTPDEFAGYKAQYKPDMWQAITSGVWECGEVGKWSVDPETHVAIYQESNIWGRLPLGA